VTNPGSMGQRAGQQAAASASRAAQQNASMAYQNQVRHSSSVFQSQQHRTGGRRRPGLFGLIGRLVGLVVSLVIIAVAIGIFLFILSQARPEWYHSVMTWLDGLL
jgi:hypothetical protein